MPDQEETKPKAPAFDFDAFPQDTLFYERRTEHERRFSSPESPPEVAVFVPRIPAERRAKKERRRRIDPTTFEKQYTDDELEFMNAMQRFKVQSGKAFPSHGEVLLVAHTLGYRKVAPIQFQTEDRAVETLELEPPRPVVIPAAVSAG